jgi:hypothetical protein
MTALVAAVAATGWMKTVAGQWENGFRGVERVGWSFAFACAPYHKRNSDQRRRG